ncbi:MAG: AmmeMemoRadiSam system protein A [Bifidobacteriaceae bacterium]|jgi:AmmeMemoRadiSam system protein A|nr:AmmeMemoRadiSam system protein A [Bifidobacteriaceae bacterium]
MPSSFPPLAGRLLTGLARAAIESAVRGPDVSQGEPPAPHLTEEEISFLAKPGAVFVTLTQDGQLRGCIGSLQAYRPLDQDVRSNAVAAALDDPRFAPLTAAELSRTMLEVSVLSEPEPVYWTTRDDLLRQLKPGLDGLILEARGRRGTFLPQVWEQLPTGDEFVGELVLKAHLPPGYWSDQIKIWRYRVTAFEENQAELLGGETGSGVDGGVDSGGSAGTEGTGSGKPDAADGTKR